LFVYEVELGNFLATEACVRSSKDGEVDDAAWPLLLLSAIDAGDLNRMNLTKRIFLYLEYFMIGRRCLWRSRQIRKASFSFFKNRYNPNNQSL